VTRPCCSGPIAAPSYYCVGFCAQLRAVFALYVAFNRRSRWFHSIITPRGNIVNAEPHLIDFTPVNTAIYSPLSAINELCLVYRNATRQRRGHPRALSSQNCRRSPIPLRAAASFLERARD
jgi:hypothetical protein